MIRKATDADRGLLLTVLKEHIIDNIYLYVDVLVLGLNKDYMKVWINDGKKHIDQVVLKYYESFQIFSKSKSISAIVQLVEQYKPTMISGEKKLIKDLHSIIKDKYKTSYGYVLEQKSIIDYVSQGNIKVAKLNDMEEVASLICTDKNIGSHYTKENLTQQLSSRLQESMGRNYVIKDGSKIIAHYATYAETENVAVLGGLIVDPEYRGLGYAKLLHTSLSNDLIKEGKRVFLFCQEYVLNLYLKLGSKVVGKYGKMVLEER